VSNGLERRRDHANMSTNFVPNREILGAADSLFKYTQTLRRDFHQYPELGFQEIRTAGIVAKELIQMGLEVKTGVGRTGVVGLLEGSKTGPVVMMRFDMDALPVQEQTGAEYASRNPGVMHACGHDGHTAIGLTVAKILSTRQAELPGTFKFVFQPAEEGLGGAEAMIADGVLTDPKPDAMLGLHLWNDKPIGWIGASAGPVMAASEIFSVIITGQGGHAAMPHLADDPVLAASQVVCGLQSIISRNVTPFESAVISITMIRGGETYNVIPPQVELKGTMRSFDPTTRKLMLEKFEQVVRGIVSAFGCEAEIMLQSTTPTLVNHPQITGYVQGAVRELLPEAELDLHYQVSVSEDMAYLMKEHAGCYFFVGAGSTDGSFVAPHHHPKFEIAEQALPLAAAIMSVAAIKTSQQI
jgi:amidohydrolase